MTANGASHVALYDLGSASADLVQALHRAGMKVTAVEPDTHDADRVREMLQRRLVGAELTVDGAVPAQCDFFICRAGHLPFAPQNAIRLALDGPVVLASVPDADRTVAIDLLDPRLAEVAWGAASRRTQSLVLAFLRRLKVPVALNVGGDAFAGALLQDKALALVDHLLLIGIAPWDLDAALELAGMTEALLKAQDHIGLEVAFARRRANETTLLIADRMVREGRLGRSVGVGWYRYPGGGGAVIDPLMEDMIVEEARFAGIAPLSLTDAQAAEALILGVINAGADLLLDGMKMDDLAMLARHRLGLPDLTKQARRWGETALRVKLRQLQAIDPDLWCPSQGLHHFGSPQT